MSEPIPSETMKAARRRLCRTIAAVIVKAMADTDTSFTLMAHRLGKKEKTVRRWISRLIDGGSKGVGLREIAEMTFACGVELEFHVRPKEQEGSALTSADHGAAT